MTAESFLHKRIFVFLECFCFCSSDNKSRSCRRSKAAKAHDHTDSPSRQVCETFDSAPGASKSTRLKELLSPSGCSQPLGLRPRPPSTARVREQPCPTSRTFSLSSFPANQTDSISRERIPVKKRETLVSAQAPSGKAEDPLSSQKHQNQKKKTSKGQAGSPSVRSCSSSDHRGLRRAQCVSTNMHWRKEPMMRNEAARIIQQAWRR